MHNEPSGAEPRTRPPVPEPLLKVLELVTSERTTNRAEIARRTGLARSTVSQQVDSLLTRGLVDEVETGESVRGRPPRALTVSRRAGIVAIADVDTRTSRIAIADLARRVLDHEVVDIPVDAGPEAVLGEITRRLRGLVDTQGVQGVPVRQVVVGLPAPVDFHRGCAVRPPIMPGWDGYPVSARLSDELDAPTVVDNDVNLMALGEAGQDASPAPLLFIKIATGIGAGLVTADGDVHRGADGAAGDIGHIRTVHGEDVLCQCGKVGCLEAVASYSAVLGSLGIPESDADSGDHVLAERVAAGDALALHQIRQAAIKISQVVAMLVHVYNPRTLVLGGPLSELCDEVLSEVRAGVYERALPLATRKLTITTSQMGVHAGVVGAIALAARRVFEPNGLARLLTRA